MKLYFYTVDYRYLGSGKTEHFLSCKESEARKTAKLYLPATQSDVFPCHLTRLPKDRVNTGEISDGFLILTEPDEESARAIWRRHYEKDADFYTRRAEECQKGAEHCREIAASL